jgi:hypothetical protein
MNASVEEAEAMKAEKRKHPNSHSCTLKYQQIYCRTPVEQGRFTQSKRWKQGAHGKL